MSERIDPKAAEAASDTASSVDEEAVAAPGTDGAAAPRRSSPSAQAASRARRIGGRPLPGPRPPARPGAGAEPAEAPVDNATDPAPVQPRRATRATRAAAPEPSAKPAATSAKLAKRPRPAARAGAGEAGSGDADTERMRRQFERLRWVPAVVAGLAVAALVGLCVWQSHGVWWAKPQHDTRDQVRQQVLAAAKPCVAAIVSYDYRNLTASEKAGQACITGTFKADYTKAMETTVKTLAPQTKTVQVFQVAKAGVERVSPDGKQWVVLIYGQQQVTNTSTAKGTPRLDILNVEATLNKVGGTWLVSSIH